MREEEGAAEWERKREEEAEGREEENAEEQ